LQQGTSAAASTFLKIMLDANAPAATRLRAAAYVFEHAAKAIELRLEARAVARHGDPGRVGPIGALVEEDFAAFGEGGLVSRGIASLKR
jgi:hypothetical protein